MKQIIGKLNLATVVLGVLLFAAAAFGASKGYEAAKASAEAAGARTTT